jgi:thiol-disulfide isomerase/thioredoxin
MFSRAAIVCLLGIAGATAACDRRTTEPEQAATAAAPVAGSVAGKVDRTHAGEVPPDAPFTLSGRKTTLSALKGRPALVNLWATWCAPCVKEMPTLEAVAKGGVRVVAVSQDMEPGKAAAFVKERGFAALEIGLDPDLALSTAYGANLPTTILYGADGREKWRVLGDRDWTDAASEALLAEAG